MFSTAPWKRTFVMNEVLLFFTNCVKNPLSRSVSFLTKCVINPLKVARYALREQIYFHELCLKRPLSRSVLTNCVSTVAEHTHSMNSLMTATSTSSSIRLVDPRARSDFLKHSVEVEVVGFMN